MSTLEQRYQDRLSNFPQLGEGRHQASLGISNLGVLAGLALEQIHDDIRKAAGSTPLSESEIRKTVLKAAAEHVARGSTYIPPPKPAPVIKDGQAALRRIIDAGTISDPVDLWEASPIRLHDSVESDPCIFLNTMFSPKELIFIGDRYDDGVLGYNIRTVAAWVVHFATGGKAGPYIIINPFTGKASPKKSGDGVSYRCDGSIASYLHCLVEFDDLPREGQIKFWSAAKLPIRALIDSGGKSIHAWLSVKKLFSVTTAEQWNRRIKTDFYEKILVPLGVDRACCNPSRLSRLPGHFREETGKFQKILWLSPEGQEVTRC
jgi:hypothetical protein